MTELKNAIVLFAFVLLLGAAGGAGGVWWLLSPAEPEDGDGTVQTDSSELAWREFYASLPSQTTVHAVGSTQTECTQVPSTLVNEEVGQDTAGRSDAPRDTVYRRLFADLEAAGPSSPSVTFGDRSGLSRVAQSRHPFLYLPVTEGGRPAIEHTGDRTTVPAYDQRGRGYTFTYRYEPPTWALFGDVWAAARWWPPAVPSPRKTITRLGADLGLRYKRARVQIGAQVNAGAGTEPIGAAVRMKGSWRLFTFAR